MTLLAEIRAQLPTPSFKCFSELRRKRWGSARHSNAMRLKAGDHGVEYLRQVLLIWVRVDHREKDHLDRSQFRLQGGFVHRGLFNA